MPFQAFTYGPFSGLNQDENPHALAPNDLIEATNVARRGETLGTRPGTSREGAGKQYENALDEANPVAGIHEHRQDVDEGRRLLVVAQHSDNPVGDGAVIAYEDNARLGVTAVMSAGTSQYWSMATHLNNTYGAGGAVTDDFWYWDGDILTNPISIDIVDSLGARVRPRYVTSWRNYLFINGLRGGGISGVNADNNPSATRFCPLVEDPTVPASWTNGSTVGFNAFGKSYTTGFGHYRDNTGDFLLILNNADIASVILNTEAAFAVSDRIANGCVSERAFVSLGIDSGDAVYVSNKGIHSLRQSQEHGAQALSFLSWKIRPLFASLNPNRFKDIVGAYDHINGRVIFAVSTGSSPTHDTLLVLDVKGEEEITSASAKWAVWRPVGISISELKMARDEDDVWRLYFGTETGDVGYFDNDTFSDLGVAYPVKFQTLHNAYGSTLSAKTLGGLMVTLQPGGDYTPTMKFHFDYGARISASRSLTMTAPTGSLWGVGVWGAATFGSSSVTRDERVYGSGSGRTIGISIEHNTANEPFWVSKIDHEIDVAGGDAGDA
jgi:hypothetical protein